MGLRIAVIETMRERPYRTRRAQNGDVNSFTLLVMQVMSRVKEYSPEEIRGELHRKLFLYG